MRDDQVTVVKADAATYPYVIHTPAGEWRMTYAELEKLADEIMAMLFAENPEVK